MALSLMYVCFLGNIQNIEHLMDEMIEIKLNEERFKMGILRIPLKDCTKLSRGKETNRPCSYLGIIKKNALHLLNIQTIKMKDLSQ